MAKLIHQKSQEIIAKEVITVENFFLRLKGLMGQKDLDQGTAFWLLPCKGGIHTFFMYFPLDLIFVNRNLEVTHVYHNVQPWKTINTFSSLFSKTNSVFEFKTPSLKNFQLEKRDQLYVDH